MISETGQKQVKLENETLRAMILPQMGGRIISLFYKGKSFEAAAQPGEKGGNAGLGMRVACMQEPYVGTEIKCPETSGDNVAARTGESGANRGCVCAGAEDPHAFAPYAYGMDDAFPNIDEEIFTWKGRKMHYPDHGEIWRTDCRIYGCGREWVELTAVSPVFSYHYVKRMSLEGNSLHIHYRIENRGAEELPAIWTWHGLTRYEENMEILLPEGAEQFRNVLDSPALGKEGTIYPVKNGHYDFTKVPGAESRSMVKYYVESRISEGYCGFYYPVADISYILQYDGSKLPYLGVWITAGGFQGDYNCALEPTNGFYDSIGRAAENRRLPVLAAGEILEFELSVTLAEGNARR